MEIEKVRIPYTLVKVNEKGVLNLNAIPKVIDVSDLTIEPIQHVTINNLNQCEYTTQTDRISDIKETAPTRLLK